MTKYNSEIHQRRSIRLKNYDYSREGSYFITICSHQMKCLFGNISKYEMVLNNFGLIVREDWLKIPSIFSEVELDEFVVMPNHFHGILVFTSPLGTIHESSVQMNQHERRKMGLAKIIGRYKMNSSKQINQLRQTKGTPVWQRNYWEHIMRNESELDRIREYISNNPTKWEVDKLYR